jgi:hypothetical protein
MGAFARIRHSGDAGAGCGDEIVASSAAASL